MIIIMLNLALHCVTYTLTLFCDSKTDFDSILALHCIMSRSLPTMLIRILLFHIEHHYHTQCIFYVQGTVTMDTADTMRVHVIMQFGSLANKAASSMSEPTSTAQGEGCSETNERSYQMPIVMRDPFRRDRKFHPQDASTVDIHLPSKLPKFPKGEV